MLKDTPPHSIPPNFPEIILQIKSTHLYFHHFRRLSQQKRLYFLQSLPDHPCRKPCRFAHYAPIIGNNTKTGIA